MRTKANRGITLISLAVAIIVIIILASIVLTVVLSNNGTINKTGEIASNYEVEDIKEQILLKITQKRRDGQITKEILADILDDYGTVQTDAEGVITGVKLTKPKGKEISIDEIYKGTGTTKTIDEQILAKGWSTEYVGDIVDGVPIPRGFRVSTVEGEKTLNDGLVIIDSSGGKNGGNEFVWIPVPEIDVMCDMENKRANFYYYNTTQMSLSGYSPTFNREPDVLTGNGTEYDADPINFSNNGVKKNGTDIYISGDGEFKGQLQTEFDAMIESVDFYKGFYMGRYEIGTGWVVKKNAVAQNGNWWTFYQKGKEIYMNSSSVVSSMLYGSQLEQLMVWLYNGTPEEKNYVLNGGTGNFSGDADGYSGVAPTGMTAGASIKNIHDIIGNMYEWTHEANNTFRRICRARSI